MRGRSAKRARYTVDKGGENEIISEMAGSDDVVKQERREKKRVDVAW